MSTVAEIEAAVHRLSAEELAELERFVRTERRRKQLPVAKRAPAAKGALALNREGLDGWRAELAARNWRQ
jgi:hypothetical protein